MDLSRWDARIDQFYADAFDASDPAGTVAGMRKLLADAEPDAEALVAFELAGVHDSLGLEDEAVPLYRAAIGAGLDDDHAAQARIQFASTLRNLGRLDEALALLVVPTVGALEPARRAFLALALHSAGRADEALREAIEGIIPSLPRYQRSLTGYAAQLNERAGDGGSA